MWIRVLGPVSVDLGNREANLGGPKQRLVFALLALRPNRAVGVDELIDDVWDEDPPGRPRKTLQVYIANLRRELGGTGRIASGPFGYRLGATDAELDLTRFEQLLATARTVERYDPARAVRALEDALALWSGAAAADLAAHPAIERLVRPLEEARADALDTVAALRIRNGGAAAAIGTLLDGVSADPWREGRWALLMEAYYRTGRQAEALETYRRVRSLLIDELGVEPGRELRDLERRILAHDATLADAPRRAVLPARPDERRTVTFASFGLAGYDRLVTDLDPEDLADVVDDFQARIAALADEHGGTVRAIADDTVTVSFGFPHAAEDDPVRAVRAALAAVGLVSSTSTTSPAGTGRSTAARVTICAGVHTGLALFRGPSAIATGQAPAVATQLRRSAGPGEVLVSMITGSLVRNRYALSAAESLAGEETALVVSGEVPRRSSELEVVPLFGRTREISQIRRVAESDEGLAVVLLTGEPGIGKSALAAAALDVPGSDALDNRPTLVIRTDRHRREASLHPIGRAIAARYRDRAELELELDLLGVSHGRLGEVAGVLSDLAGWSPGPDAPPPAVLAASSRRSAVATWLSVLGSAQPLRLVVEDLHDADPETVTLLDELVDEIGAGLLLVVSRSAVFPPRLEARGHRIELGRLAPAAARSLVNAAAGPTRLRLDVVNRLIEYGAGHPLHLQELAFQAAENQRARSAGRLPAGPADRWRNGVPATLQASLLARLDLLGADKPLVQRCAVIGDRFELETAAYLGDDEAEPDSRGRAWRLAELGARLDALTRAGVFRRTEMRGRRWYAFAQKLLEDTAYASLPRAVRIRLHRRIADRMAAGEHPDAGRLAEHLEAAGQLPPAALGWVRAAEAALAAAAFSDAAAYARRALHDLEQLPEGAERDSLTVGAQLLLATAIKMTVISDPELEHTLFSAFELAKRLGRADLLVRFYPILISTLQALGRYEEAARRGAEAMPLAEALGNPMIVRRARHFQAATLTWMGRLDEAAAIYTPSDRGSAEDSVVSTLMRAAEVLTDCAGLALTGLSRLTQGRTAESEELFARARNRATEARAAESICLTGATLAIARQLAGDVAGTHELAEATSELALQLGNDWWFVWSQAVLGWAVAAEGNPAEGLAMILEAVEHAGDVRQLLPYFGTLAAEAELALGHVDRALQRLRDAAAMAESTGERFFLPYVHVITVSALEAADASQDEIELHRGIALDLARRQGQQLFVRQVART